MKTCIVLDLDGCISDDRWRRHLITPLDLDPYGEYHRAIPFDNFANRRAVQDFAKAHPLVICTGREERYRRITETWLDDQRVIVARLLMRKDGDRRSAPALKVEMVSGLIKEGIQIIGAYDDREDVIAAYRDLGVRAIRMVCL
jgi:hypothetical protein